jgi:hypothetical protein
MDCETTASEAVRDSDNKKLLVGIGDIHGHLDRLEILWQKLEDAVGVERLQHQSTVVFLGDYCDRGPNTKVI